MPSIDLIVGARPNFMKAAPVLAQLRRRHPDWEVRLIHTGQHYDDRMSEQFLRQLKMPAPDVDLGVGSGSHGVQTARVMVALEQLLTTRRPDVLMVFGDVNSTLAAALVASKMLIPLAHVEAGLRSFDRKMPEEVNRVITDAVSEWLFTTEPSAEINLKREGVAAERIHFVGNTMIDTLLEHKAAARDLRMARQCGVEPGRYVVVTLHRPSNVDDAKSMQRLLTALEELASRVPVVFSVHPRTAQRLEDWGLAETAHSAAGLRMFEPLGYLQFLSLIMDAGAVVTDSGGVQEETTVLGVPCITLRENTERPVTLTSGTNVLVGNDTTRMLEHALRAIDGNVNRRPHIIIPEKWDGRAAERIVTVLEASLSS